MLETGRNGDLVALLRSRPNAHFLHILSFIFSILGLHLPLLQPSAISIFSHSETLRAPYDCGELALKDDKPQSSGPGLGECERRVGQIFARIWLRRSRALQPDNVSGQPMVAIGDIDIAAKPGDASHKGFARHHSGIDYLLFS